MSIILNTYKAKEVMEGAGVLVNRVFGYYETKEFDPFLMLDYFETDTDTESPGFPWHPHKGMETISYFLRGGGEHQDSMGNKGVIGAGELQWMSAASGVMHQELPVRTKGGYQGFQFWVNLPASQKLKDPSYQYIKKGEMKSSIVDGVEVKVISGSYNNVLGPIIKDDLGITMLHVIMEPNTTFKTTRDSNKHGFLFIFEGHGTLNKKDIKEKTAYTLGSGELVLESKDKKVQFIYAEGTPLREPIAWRGPIVMNTQDELLETFRDLQNGTFGK